MVNCILENRLVTLATYSRPTGCHLSKRGRSVRLRTYLNMHEVTRITHVVRYGKNEGLTSALRD